MTLQKKERERLKERAENWKRIEALAAENPDMETIAEQGSHIYKTLSHFKGFGIQWNAVTPSEI